jgi:hypothetical protein
MKTAICHLVGESPYSQSKKYDDIDVPRLSKELPDDYEKRTWRNRMHTTKDGHVFIPGSCFANSLMEAVRRLQIKIPGQGNSKYTKNFEAGIMITDGITLPIKAVDVPGERLYVPANGQRGHGKRVYRIFPRIDEWEGKITVYIFDDIITADIFRIGIVSAGQLVGVGRFRPANRGFYGRFSVKEIIWCEGEDALANLGQVAA